MVVVKSFSCYCLFVLWLMDLSAFVFIFQAIVHCRRDFNRVSFKGHWDRCRVGPNAWNEGICGNLNDTQFCEYMHA